MERTFKVGDWVTVTSRGSTREMLNVGRVYQIDSSGAFPIHLDMGNGDYAPFSEKELKLNKSKVIKKSRSITKNDLVKLIHIVSSYHGKHLFDVQVNKLYKEWKTTL